MRINSSIFNPVFKIRVDTKKIAVNLLFHRGALSNEFDFIVFCVVTLFFLPALSKN